MTTLPLLLLCLALPADAAFTAPYSLKVKSTLPSSVAARPHRLMFTSDGRTLVAQGGHGDNGVRIWDVPSGTLRGKVGLPTQGPDSTTVLLSRDGSRVAAGGSAQVHLLDAASGRLIRSWKVDAANEKYTGQGRYLALSEDGAFLAFGDADKLRLVSGADGRELGSWKLAAEKYDLVSAMSFSPDGAWLAATSGRRGSFAFIDLKTRKLQDGPADACALSPQRIWWTADSTRLYSHAGDNSVCVFDPAPGGSGDVLATGVLPGGLLPVGGDGASLQWTDQAGLQGTLRLRDAQGASRGSWRGVFSPLFTPYTASPDGGLAAYKDGSGSSDGNLVLLDLATQSLRWLRPDSYITTLAFSPDNRYLAVGGLGASVVDTTTGRRSAPQGSVGVSAAAWSPDAKTVAFALASGQIQLFEFGPFVPQAYSRPTAPARLSLSAHAVEPRVVAGSTVVLRALLDNEGAGTAYGIQLQASLEPQRPGALAPDDQELYSLQGGASQYLLIEVPTTRELKTGKLRVKLQATEANGFDSDPVTVEAEVQGFEPPRLELAGVELPGGPLKAAESVEAVVKLRNAGGGRAEGVSVALELGSPDIFLEREGPVSVGSIGPGEVKRASFRFFVNKRYAGAKLLPLRASATESLGLHGFKPRALRLAVGEGAPPDFAFSAEDDELPEFEPKRLAQLVGEGDLAGLRVSRDGRWLAASEARTKLLVFDAASGGLKSRHKADVVSAEHSSLQPAGFLSDGMLAAVADNQVIVVDPATGKARKFWSGARTRYEKRATGSAFQPYQTMAVESIQSAAVSPDGRRVFVGGCYEKDEEALLFDYPSATPRALPGPKGCVMLARFSPDGSLLAFSRSRGLVEVWDMESGQRRASFDPPQGDAAGLAWLPDNRGLAVSSWRDFNEKTEPTFSLWDAPTGTRLAALGKPDDLIYEAAASPDGRWLVYSGSVMELPARVKRGVIGGAAGSLAFLPDGRLAAAQGRTVGLFSLTGGKVTAPKPTAPAKLTASVSFSEPSGDRRLGAGEKGELVLKVTNAGPGKAHGLRSIVGLAEPVAGLKLPDNAALGDLSAGASLERRLPLGGLLGLAAGKARVRLSVREANGFDAPDSLIEFETLDLKAPRLEVSGLSLAGTGVVKPAEVNKLSVSVRNTGAGAASGVSAEFVPGDADIFPAGDVKKELGALAAGETKRVEFEFFVNARFKGKQLPSALTVTESLGGFGFARRPLGLVLGEAPAAQLVAVQGRDAAAPAAVSEDVDEPPVTKVKTDPDALAVVIGVERYRQAGIPGVDHAARDARTMHAYFTRSMGVDSRNAILLLDEGAGKSDLEKYLGSWLKNRATSSSRVLVFFAGHGAPDAATGEAYLVPFDGDPAYTKDTAFPLRRLYNTLKELPARDVTVMLDSCFSGQGGRSLIAKGTRPLVSVRTGLDVGGNTAALAAAGPGQISSSYDAAGHGLMTYHLLKGLKGGADADKDGRVTFGELADYVGPEVERSARLNNVEQVPQVLPGRDALGARAKRVLIELR